MSLDRDTVHDLADDVLRQTGTAEEVATLEARDDAEHLAALVSRRRRGDYSDADPDDAA